MFVLLAIGGIPGSGSAAAVRPDTCSCIDADADGGGGAVGVPVDIGVLGAGTATLAGARRCVLSLPQPTANTTTTVATVAPVMLSRCQRVRRCWGGSTRLLAAGRLRRHDSRRTRRDHHG